MNKTHSCCYLSGYFYILIIELPNTLTALCIIFSKENSVEGQAEEQKKTKLRVYEK